MADTKISALPSASTPLTGTEVLPIVQGAANFKVSVSDLTAGRPLSATAITLTSGTANGVTYLNGSKVLTSGTALTFDGTTLGVSSGSSTPALKLYGVAVSQGQLQFSSTSGYVIQGGPDYTGLVYNVGSAAYQHIWQINSAEQMRLTSTGLGIGTSSPGYRLQVYNNINGTPFAWGNAARTGFLYQDANGVGITNAAATGFDEGVYLDTANSKVVLYTNSTERVTLDSAGNLGLGVTPSAWSITNKVFEIGALGSGLWANSVGDFRAFANMYYNAGYKYAGTGLATLYQQTTGTHQWYNAPSGTAGAAITFTQAMTLDASGNFGIGTTSPAALLHLSSGNGTKAIWGTTRSFTVNRNWQVAVDEYAEGQFTITPSTTLGGTTFTTPAIRLDSSGNLGLGVTPSAWAADRKAMQVNLASLVGGNSNNFLVLGNNIFYDGSTKYITATAASQYVQNTSGAHFWSTSTGTPAAGGLITFTQAMTLDASGRLIVGGTTASGTSATFNGGQASVVIAQSSSTSYGGLRIYNDINTGARALEIDYSGSGYSGSLITGGPSGESASIATTGTFALALGTNNTARITITAAGNQINSGTISPQQATTAAAPTYVKGAMYFDTTLNKLRIGGATGWETVTSV